ncbi:MAG: YicC family protein [Gammaproteobacteria bacterium]|nr:YicC family protein [Gammaproteobacteria bacterium]
MICSMTAFARVELAAASGALTWELRSVNHRYLDVTIKLPDEVRVVETAVRERIAGSIRRGKLDAVLRYAPQAGNALQIDHQQLDQLIKTVQQVERDLDNPSRVSALDLMHWPGIMQATRIDGELLQQAALQSLGQALSQLVTNRQREGEALQALLLSRCGALDQQVEQVRQRLPQVVEAQRTRLKQRLAEFQAELDPQRLEQEMVYLIQRQDVEEELDRLGAHLAETRRVLAGGEPVGRRLDFLMQELNREVNTLASKSLDPQLTYSAVDMKVLIEQMREQIQNIE